MVKRQIFKQLKNWVPNSILSIVTLNRSLRIQWHQKMFTSYSTLRTESNWYVDVWKLCKSWCLQMTSSISNTLVDIMTSINCDLGTKITKHHVDFHNDPMEVRLAVQLLSKSVADAIEFLMNSLPHEKFIQKRCGDGEIHKNVQWRFRRIKLNENWSFWMEITVKHRQRDSVVWKSRFNH